jgi:MtN3 and saliva related transmembrane protein
MESALAVAAATWAIAMALGPLLQMRKIVRHQSARTISVGYFVVLLIGFLLWLAYGIAADNYALIIPNAVAAVVISATIAVTLRYRRVEDRSPDPREDPGPV